MEYAILFPGQGSQSVGMCADARAAYPDVCGGAANDVLGWDLGALIDNGPEELLTETQHAQPALFAVSYALWLEFSGHMDMAPAAAAGHSLGEYTALAAAGALNFSDGLRLVSQRGQAMALAGRAEDSGMAAILGADEAVVSSVVGERAEMGGRLVIANINAPGQIVVAGGSDDLDWLDKYGRDLGLRRVIRLKVQGAFHSPFMLPAASALEQAVGGVQFLTPDFVVYANSTAQPTTDPANTLVEQLTSTVRFSETLRAMRTRGIETFVHIGPGDVTAGLAKRTLRGVDVRIVSTLEEASAVAGDLSIQ